MTSDSCPIAEAAARLAGAGDGRIELSAATDSSAVGMLAMTPEGADCGWLEELFPDWRGIGSFLEETARALRLLAVRIDQAAAAPAALTLYGTPAARRGSPPSVPLFGVARRLLPSGETAIADYYDVRAIPPGEMLPAIAAVIGCEGSHPGHAPSIAASLSGCGWMQYLTVRPGTASASLVLARPDMSRFLNWSRRHGADDDRLTLIRNGLGRIGYAAAKLTRPTAIRLYSRPQRLTNPARLVRSLTE